jgi:hypothetical protein
MRYKASFVVGMAVGYVLGARAGRERYEQIARGARTFMENPRVRQASGAVGQRGGELLNTATHKVSEQLGGRFGPHLPPWAPGHRATGTRGDWARASETRTDGYGSEDPSWTGST